MVPIETRSIYLQEITNNTLLASFNDFLKGRSLVGPSLPDVQETDQICFDSIRGIVQNSSAEFDFAYQKISKRLPNKNSPSPFVHNDYLIFVLIAGIIKFNYDLEWVRKILDVRSKSVTTTTFENIINENYYSKSSHLGTVLCFLNLILPSKINKTMQDDCYQQVVENPALFEEKNDFLKLCTLNAYDSIIISREIVDISQYNFLKVFEEKFLGRTSILARVIYNLLLILLFWGLYKVLIKYPNIQEAVGNFGLIVGLAGVSAANFLSSVCKKIEIVIRKLLGYR